MHASVPSETSTRRADLILLLWLSGMWVAHLLISVLLFVIHALIDPHAMTVFMWGGIVFWVVAMVQSLILLGFLIRFAVRHPRRFWISLAIGLLQMGLFCLYCGVAVMVTGM